MKKPCKWIRKMWNILLELSPRVRDEYAYALYRQQWWEDNSPY